MKIIDVDIFLFFISLKYLFLFIFYLSGGKTYQPALVQGNSCITRVLQHGSSLDCPNDISPVHSVHCLGFPFNSISCKVFFNIIHQSYWGNPTFLVPSGFFNAYRVNPLGFGRSCSRHMLHTAWFFFYSLVKHDRFITEKDYICWEINNSSQVQDNNKRNPLHNSIHTRNK